MGIKIITELRTRGNTARYSKREGGIFMTHLQVKANSNWPNMLYIYTQLLHDGWKGRSLFPLSCLTAFPIWHSLSLTASIRGINYDCHLVPQAALWTTSNWSAIRFPFISGCSVVVFVFLFFIVLKKFNCVEREKNQPELRKLKTKCFANLVSLSKISQLHFYIF